VTQTTTMTKREAALAMFDAEDVLARAVKAATMTPPLYITTERGEHDWAARRQADIEAARTALAAAELAFAQYA